MSTGADHVFPPLRPSLKGLPTRAKNPVRSSGPTSPGVQRRRTPGPEVRSSRTEPPPASSPAGTSTFKSLAALPFFRPFAVSGPPAGNDDPRSGRSRGLRFSNIARDRIGASLSQSHHLHLPDHTGTRSLLWTRRCRAGRTSTHRAGMPGRRAGYPVISDGGWTRGKCNHPRLPPRAREHPLRRQGTQPAKPCFECQTPSDSSAAPGSTCPFLRRPLVTPWEVHSSGWRRSRRARSLVACVLPPPDDGSRPSF
jgi:hypothetical protein